MLWIQIAFWEVCFFVLWFFGFDYWLRLFFRHVLIGFRCCNCICERNPQFFWVQTRAHLCKAQDLGERSCMVEYVVNYLISFLFLQRFLLFLPEELLWLPPKCDQHHLLRFIVTKWRYSWKFFGIFTSGKCCQMRKMVVISKSVIRGILTHWGDYVFGLD